MLQRQGNVSNLSYKMGAITLEPLIGMLQQPYACSIRVLHRTDKALVSNSHQYLDLLVEM